MDLAQVLITAPPATIGSAAVFLRFTAYSRFRPRRVYWRIKLRMHPALGFASIAELGFRWSRWSAVRFGGKVRPDLPAYRRLLMPASRYSWYLGRGQWGKRVYTSAEHQTAIIAPPRQGKTGVLAERILGHDGAVITFTTREDLWRITAGVRSQQGPVYVFNPFGIGSVPSNLYWDLIDGCQDPTVASRRAASLIGDKASGDMTFWIEKAVAVLASLMHMAAVGGKTMADVYRWANSIAGDEIIRIAKTARSSAAMALSVNEAFKQDSKSADSIRMTMLRSLSWLAIPELAAMVAWPVATPFNMARFAAQRGSIYMMLDGDANSSVAAPLFRCFVDEAHYQGNVAGSQTRYRKLVPPVFYALDEVANIQLPHLDHKLADSAGHGQLMTLVFHSVAQLASVYGEHQAQAILGCCGTKIILPGLAEADTLQELATICGEVPDGEQVVQVITPDMIRRLPDGRALVLSVNKSAVAVKFRVPWHRLSHRLGRFPEAEVPGGLTTPELVRPWTGELGQADEPAAAGPTDEEAADGRAA
jgi:type IV secretory pathway TraG/TraD family ATPase VirD4